MTWEDECGEVTTQIFKMTSDARSGGCVENILPISAPPSHAYKSSVVATSDSTINSLALAYNPSGYEPHQRFHCALLPWKIHASW